MNRAERIKMGEAFEEANAIATAPLPTLQFFTFECDDNTYDRASLVIVKSTSRKKAKPIAEEEFRKAGFSARALKKITCINQVRIIAEDQIIFSDANGR